MGLDTLITLCCLSIVTCKGATMEFLSFLVLCAIAFFLWRIADQMPDVLFSLSEMQKDIAAMRRQDDSANE